MMAPRTSARGARASITSNRAATQYSSYPSMKLITVVTITLATSTSAFVSSGGKATLCQQASSQVQKRDTKPFELEVSLPSSREVPDKTASRSSKLPSGIRESLALSPNEMLMNMYQLSAIFVMIGLIRIPYIANLVVSSLQYFPHYTLIKYEALSLLDWLVHYSVLAYNIGILQSLLRNNVNSSTKKKRAFAIVVTGLGHLFGITTILSHSLIGSRISPLAEQALHNFSHFSMAFSAMSIGGTLLLPAMLGIPSSFLIGHALRKGALSFQTVPGIVLCCLGILAVGVSSENDFPRRFKMGYGMLALNPVIAKLVNLFISPEADLAHTMVAGWISLSIILQRSSLVEQKHYSSG